jgi:hypothetical protein
MKKTKETTGCLLRWQGVTFPSVPPFPLFFVEQGEADENFLLKKKKKLTTNENRKWRWGHKRRPVAVGADRNGVEDNDDEEMEEEGRPESTDRGHDVLLAAAAAATFKGWLTILCSTTSAAALLCGSSFWPIKIPFRSASFVGRRHLLLLFYLSASGTATRNHEQRPQSRLSVESDKKKERSFFFRHLTGRTIHLLATWVSSWFFSIGSVSPNRPYDDTHFNFRLETLVGYDDDDFMNLRFDDPPRGKREPLTLSDRWDD